ncbi:hypothetical protein QBC40DRAFT_269163 [Triangularia verruculosa]|uniref:Prolyl 4-hydroxylase alpha subunit Fe(2+) 2OG dioxygenase domain-containing protein n=1 Tax=Triangularia verruculosa TaxID=2587418 RepID=A0AAN6XA30_9PEZI|nr:hypothetical protein QBC40DRAFT_269163 [Triangularia verruculosa]
MFGTLVIALPSPHTGGNVVVKHCGRKDTFKTSDSAQSYVCWYSDVIHEVLPVLSGYRWVLTYNLAIDPEQGRPSAEGLLQRKETQTLRDSLNHWLTEAQMDSFFHLFDYDYTQANMSFDTLKQSDLARTQALVSLSKELPFDIFLALVERERRGECESDSVDSNHHFIGFGEIIEDSYSVDTLYDLRGNKIASNMPLTDDDFLDDEPFEGYDDYKEEYEGYMGNTGPQATHWYRTGAVVVVPRERIVDFFTKDRSEFVRRENAENVASYLTGRCLIPNPLNTDIAALKAFCRKAWKKVSGLKQPRQTPFQCETISDICKAAITLEDLCFFEEAMAIDGGRLPADFLAWLRQWMMSSINIENRFGLVRRGLETSVSKCPTPIRKVRAIALVAPPPINSSTTTHSQLEWARGLLRSVCEDHPGKWQGVKWLDGNIMADIGFYNGQPFAFLMNNVLPTIDVTASWPYFLAFHARLQEHSASGSYPASATARLCKSLAALFIDSCKFDAHRLDAAIAPLKLPFISSTTIHGELEDDLDLLSDILDEFDSDNEEALDDLTLDNLSKPLPMVSIDSFSDEDKVTSTSLSNFFSYLRP